MPFFPIRNDITRMDVDAVVNAANRSLLGGGGVDGAIHRAAGPELLAECRTLGGCGTGEAKLTRGYRLPAKYVIHTVGPIYSDGRHGEETLLRSCYKKSLAIAEEKGLESVAFPLISAGAYGYPREEAIRVANEEIAAFLEHSDMTVYLVFYDRDSFFAGRSRYPELESRIEESQVARNVRSSRRRLEEEAAGRGLTDFIPAPLRARRFGTHTDPVYETEQAECLQREEASVYPGSEGGSMPGRQETGRPAPHKIGTTAGRMPASLDDALKNRDESFAQMLFRCIDARGMTDPECYRRANVDKKLFSKIRSKPDYRPTKSTVVAFAVALRLDREQTEQLLRRAGLALNGHDTFDIIVDYFISRGEYNIWKINEQLFRYDQNMLGSN